MSKKFNPNEVYTGNTGRTWVSNQQMANISKIDAKITGEFEDAPVGGQAGTGQVYLGYAVEGTVEMWKTDSDLLKQVAEGFKTGIMPDIKINTEVKAPSTGVYERLELLNVVFTEIPVGYEAKQAAKISLPFKASDFNFLD